MSAGGHSQRGGGAGGRQRLPAPSSTGWQPGGIQDPSLPRSLQVGPHPCSPFPQHLGCKGGGAGEERGLWRWLGWGRDPSGTCPLSLVGLGWAQWVLHVVKGGQPSLRRGRVHWGRGHRTRRGTSVAVLLLLLCTSPNSYNPFEGPNENPEAELPLTAGEYIYIYGNMDEDGFFEGRKVVGIILSIRLLLSSSSRRPPPICILSAHCNFSDSAERHPETRQPAGKGKGKGRAVGAAGLTPDLPRARQGL